MHYIVELRAFDYDTDHHSVQWREYKFSDADKANEFYNFVLNLDYDEEMHSRKYATVSWREDEEVSERLGIDGGGVYKDTVAIYRITRERIR